jgi:hypothetical protein
MHETQCSVASYPSLGVSLLKGGVAEAREYALLSNCLRLIPGILKNLRSMYGYMKYIQNMSSCLPAASLAHQGDEPKLPDKRADQPNQAFCSAYSCASEETGQQACVRMSELFVVGEG